MGLPHQIARAFNGNQQVFGRQEVIDVDGKQVTIILVKNPVGLDQVLHMIGTDKEKFSWLACSTRTTPTESIPVGSGTAISSS